MKRSAWMLVSDLGFNVTVVLLIFVIIVSLSALQSQNSALQTQNTVILKAVCVRFKRDEKILADALPTHAERLLAKKDCPAAMRAAER